MSKYIDRKDALRILNDVLLETAPDSKEQSAVLKCSHLIEQLPAVDVAPIEALKKRLWKVALNNSDNYLGDACEELVNQLDGLRRYANECREENK